MWHADCGRMKEDPARWAKEHTHTHNSDFLYLDKIGSGSDVTSVAAKRGASWRLTHVLTSRGTPCHSFMIMPHILLWCQCECPVSRWNYVLIIIISYSRKISTKDDITSCYNRLWFYQYCVGYKLKRQETPDTLLLINRIYPKLSKYLQSIVSWM